MKLYLLVTATALISEVESWLSTLRDRPLEVGVEQLVRCRISPEQLFPAAEFTEFGEAHRGPVTSVEISLDSNLVVTSGEDGIVKVYNTLPVVACVARICPFGPEVELLHQVRV